MRFQHLPMTHLLPAIALIAAPSLPPAPTASDTPFAHLSLPSIVAIVRYVHRPGIGDSA